MLSARLNAVSHVWIPSLTELIEECLIDSDDCEKLEAAIKNLQQMAGGDWAGTAC